MSTVPDAARDLRSRLRDVVWSNLPVLLVGSVPVALGWAFARSLPASLGWMAVLVVGLVVLPLLAALLAGCELLLAEEHVGVLGLVRSWPARFLPALRVTAAPTATVLLTVLALQLERATGQRWMLASVAVSGALSVLLLAVGVVALPYAVRTGARAREAWLVSAFLASRNPVAVLAVLAVLVLATGAAAASSLAVLLLLPAPLALVWAVAVTSATARGRQQLPALPR